MMLQVFLQSFGIFFLITNFVAESNVSLVLHIFLRPSCYAINYRLTGVTDAQICVVLATKNFFLFLYNINRSPINYDKHLIRDRGGIL